MIALFHPLRRRPWPPFLTLANWSGHLSCDEQPILSSCVESHDSCGTRPAQARSRAHIACTGNRASLLHTSTACRIMPFQTPGTVQYCTYSLHQRACEQVEKTRSESGGARCNMAAQPGTTGSSAGGIHRGTARHESGCRLVVRQNEDRHTSAAMVELCAPEHTLMQLRRSPAGMTDSHQGCWPMRVCARSSSTVVYSIDYSSFPVLHRPRKHRLAAANPALQQMPSRRNRLSLVAAREK
jgi:hypothetical protein